MNLRQEPIFACRRQIEIGEDGPHGVTVKACGLSDSEIRYRCRKAKVRHEDGFVFHILAVWTTITARRAHQKLCVSILWGCTICAGSKSVNVAHRSASQARQKLPDLPVSGMTSLRGLSRSLQLHPCRCFGENDGAWVSWAAAGQIERRQHATAAVTVHSSELAIACSGSLWKSLLLIAFESHQ